MKLDRKTMRRLALLIAFGIVLYLGLSKFTSIISTILWAVRLFYPFILGLCIAFILNIPMRFFERVLFSRNGKDWKPEKTWQKRLHQMHRPISLVLTLILVFGIIAVVLLLIIPELARTLVSLANRIPRALTDVQIWITDLFNRFPDAESWAQSVNWSDIGSKLTSFLQGSASSLLDSTFSTIVSVVSGLFTFFLALIFAIYILLQKEKFGSQLKHLLYAYFPNKRIDQLIHLGTLSNKTFSSFLSCQCFEAVLLGLLFFSFMNIFGFPYSVLISVVIAFAALIPIFGAIIGCVAGALLIFVVSPAQAFWFVVMFIVLQQLEGNFIYPNVVGNSVGLPSILVLMAVTIGGSLMGVPGMLIFIPLCSILYALLRENVHKRLRDTDQEEQDPDDTQHTSGFRRGQKNPFSQFFSSVVHRFTKTNDSEETDPDTDPAPEKDDPAPQETPQTDAPAESDAPSDYEKDNL